MQGQHPLETAVTPLSPVLMEVRVEVPWDHVRQHLDGEFQRLGREARVRGYRPGKVPASVVRQLFGKQVRSEVAAHLVEEGLFSAVQKHELQIVARPDVAPPDLSEGNPVVFTAKVEVRPKIERVDLEGLEVQRPGEEVSDAAVGEEIELLRRQHAAIRAPEPPRPAKAGDVLRIDYTVSIDGKEQEELGSNGREVELGDDRLIPEFEAGLLGSSAGETKQVAVRFADDHGSESVRGKDAVFHVRVHEVKERILPELDDEFAKDCGDYKTLLELRLEVRKRLETMAAARATAELKDRIVDKLVALNPVPVPPSMVRQEQQQMMYSAASFARMAGQDLPVSEEFMKRTEERAERRVRAALLFGAIAREQAFAVSEEDVEAHLRELAQKTGKHLAKVKADHQGERREMLEAELLEEKLMNYLRSRARMVDGPAPGELGKPGPEERP